MSVFTYNLRVNRSHVDNWYLTVFLGGKKPSDVKEAVVFDFVSNKCPDSSCET